LPFSQLAINDLAERSSSGAAAIKRALARQSRVLVEDLGDRQESVPQRLPGVALQNRKDELKLEIH
jgi:hypothetical protein